MVIRELNSDSILFYCPGCDDPHVVNLTEGFRYNNDADSPKIHPSIYVLEQRGGYDHVCHLFITDGWIHYLPDCSHELVEQSVPMCPLPEYLVPEEPKEVEETEKRDRFYYPNEDIPEEYEGPTDFEVKVASYISEKTEEDGWKPPINPNIPDFWYEIDDD